MGADTTAIKKHQRNPMNMTTKVGNHRFEKGDSWYMYVGTYGLFVYKSLDISEGVRG